MVHLPRQQPVILRTRGDRYIEEVPLTEIAEVAREEIRSHPDAGRDDLRRVVMAAFDVRRLTEKTTAIADRAIAIARRDLSKQGRTSGDWDLVHLAIAAIPSGRWTSFNDLAELAGTSTGWVARHLYGRWELNGLHRVLERSGAAWRWFQWPDGRDEDVIDVLRSEGIVSDRATTAEPLARLDGDALRSLLSAGGDAHG